MSRLVSAALPARPVMTGSKSRSAPTEVPDTPDTLSQEPPELPAAEREARTRLAGRTPPSASVHPRVGTRCRLRLSGAPSPLRSSPLSSAPSPVSSCAQLWRGPSSLPSLLRYLYHRDGSINLLRAVHRLCSAHGDRHCLHGTGHWALRLKVWLARQQQLAR